jgi:signal transduction histidine kinase
VRLGCSETEGDLVCVIEDDGRGIRADEHGKGKTKGGGLGLLDMQERLSFLGGTLGIASSPRRGTTVTIRIPLKRTITKDHL